MEQYYPAIKVKPKRNRYNLIRVVVVLILLVKEKETNKITTKWERAWIMIRSSTNLAHQAINRMKVAMFRQWKRNTKIRHRSPDILMAYLHQVNFKVLSNLGQKIRGLRVLKEAQTFKEWVIQFLETIPGKHYRCITVAKEELAWKAIWNQQGCRIR